MKCVILLILSGPLMAADFMHEAKQKTQGIIEKIIGHPFLVTLANGTLARTVFDDFSKQDNIYSWRYADALSLLAIKTSNSTEQLFFLKAAKSSTQEWGGLIPENIEQCPSCQAYSDFELASVQQSYPQGLASIAPCYMVYACVATWLAENSVSDNPYQDWIDQYAEPGFQAHVHEMESIMNRAAHTSPSEREGMLIAY